MADTTFAARVGALVLAAAGAALAGNPEIDQKADALVAAALGESAGDAPPSGVQLFRAVVDSEAFVGASVGPLDVRVRVADKLKKPKEAKRVLDQIVAGLEPAAKLLAERFGRADGLISGHRFVLVFASSDVDGGEPAYSEVLALIDRCEDGGWSGWKPDLPVYNTANLHAPVVQTWEVLAFNLAQPEAVAGGKTWLAHGVGYHVLNFLSNLLLQFGAYGPVPPWLQQGLADELDIAAYGQAWVAGGESSEWSESRGGWSSQGWEGFLPEGQSPPPPVLTPPEPLSRTEESHVSDDGWISRGDSSTRHWTKLAADLRTDAPPSLQRAAAARADSPRDRAYARLVLHLLLRKEGKPADVPDLLEALDTRPKPVAGGLRGGEPLTVIFGRALGGVPELDALEAQTLEQQLDAAARSSVAEAVRGLGTPEILNIPDHRKQSEWLYTHPEIDTRRRIQLFEIIVESENVQQLREWEVLGAELDRATLAALGRAKAYPKDPTAFAAVVGAFRDTLGQPLEIAPR
jgi:hypothetical protein